MHSVRGEGRSCPRMDPALAGRSGLNAAKTHVRSARIAAEEDVQQLTSRTVLGWLQVAKLHFWSLKASSVESVYTSVEPSGVTL